MSPQSHCGDEEDGRIGLYMYITITQGFFEVAIESWPEWDLKPRPINSVQRI